MAEEREQQNSDNIGSELVFDFYCELCKEDGKLLEAEGYCVDCEEYLCSMCYTCHKRTRGTRHHELMDKDTMPRDTPLAHEQVNKDISKKCSNHKGKTVKYYCKSHDFLGCSVCIIKGHGNCTDVDNIPEVSGSIMKSQEYKDFIEMLNQFDERSRDNIKLVKTNLTKSQSWCSDILKSVQTFREEINSILDELEKSVMTQAEGIQKEEEKKLLNISDKSTTCLQSVEKSIREIDHLQKSMKVCEIFIQLKELKKEAMKIQAKLSKAERENAISEYGFDPNTKLIEFLNSQNGFGKLSVQATVTAFAMGLSNFNPVRIKATYMTDIKVKSGKDGYDSIITGSAVVSNNRLLIVDLNDNKIKLTDTQSNNVISELTVSSSPWDVTVAGRNQAAVTLCDSQRIQLLSMSDTLKLDREITVKGECRGVAFSKNRLVVTYVNPVKLEIMDLSGKVMKRVENDSYGNKLFERPQYVCVSKDEDAIYVSDFNSNKLISLTFEGVVKSVYRDSELEGPEKVCIDHHGNVYVCGRDSRNVHMLTADLTKIQIILTQQDGLDRFVYSVSHCPKTNRLYVGMKGKTVKVHQLSL